MKVTKNRKITKTMAYEAASSMKKKAYSKKIENAYKKLNEAGQILVRKYIPAPVIACVNEYSTYFGYTMGCAITAIKERSDGSKSYEKYISVSLQFKLPNYSSDITVEREDYAIVRKLYDKVKMLENQRDEFGDQVYEALIALKTENAVKKELPEAMKFLVFPEVKALPMPVFTGLRSIIGSIKED